MVIFRSDVHRTQEANRRECMTKLQDMVRNVARLVAPAPTSKEQVHHVESLYHPLIIIIVLIYRYQW